jgi:hypothetical protein
LIRAVSMEQQMLTRMTLIVPATLALCFTTTCLSGQPSRATNDCLAQPNAAPPPGSHWYYRLDRATHRQCWYLGAEDAKAHSRARQTVSAARPRAPKATLQAAEETAVETTTAAPAPEIPAGIAVPDDTTATLSTRWSGFPKSAVAIDPAPVSMSNSYVQEQPPTASEDEMPLIWPILTPAESSQAERSSQSSISISQLAAAFAAVLGLVALIAHALVRLTSGSKTDRAETRSRRSAQPRSNIVRRPVNAARDTTPEVEASVQRLLHELHRRRQENSRRELQETPRTVMA